MLNVQFHYKSAGLECYTTVCHFHAFIKIPLSIFLCLRNILLLEKENEIN